MILLPTARILIQKAGAVPTQGINTGQADFLVLPIADASQNKLGIVSTCEVEFSTTKEATAVVVTFEVANLHPSVARQIAEAGYVKIEAGYIGHPTRPSQVIFFGRLDSYNYRLSSGKIKWTFTATAFPLEIWGLKPSATAPIDNSGVPLPITIGEAVRILADRIGIGRANVHMPKIFDGDLSDTVINSKVNKSAQFSSNFKNAVTLRTWTTTRTATEELQDLMNQVSQVMQTTFGVVSNYSLLSDSNNPFIIVINDITKYSGESMNIDLDSSQIIDAGPAQATTMTKAPDNVDGTESDAIQVVQVPEYQFVSVFDPKFSMGLLVKGTSAEFGIEVKVKITKGKHSLNGSPLRWRTEASGQLQIDAEVSRGA